MTDSNEADMSSFSKTPSKAMLAMPGFCKGDDWLVRRSHANNFPTQRIGLLLPHLREWTTEIESDDRGKTKAPASILHKMNPHLARVRAQDGKFSNPCSIIVLISIFSGDFEVARHPDHAMSIFLLSRVGPTR